MAQETNRSKLRRKPGLVVLQLDSPRNPYSARNFGIANSTRSHIALLDSTCTPGTDYLSTLWNTCQEENAALVAGEIEFELPESPSLGEMVDALVFMRNSEQSATRKAYPGGSLFFPYRTFEQVGPFRDDLRSGPDGEWTNRVFQYKMIVSYAPGAIVRYPAKNWNDLMKEGLRDGKGHGALARERGDFSIFRTLLEMRPPSPAFLNKILATRGRPDFRAHKVRIWFGIWAFRIAFSRGKLMGE